MRHTWNIWGNIYIANRDECMKKRAQLLLTSLAVKQKEWVLIWIYIGMGIEFLDILSGWCAWYGCICLCTHAYVLQHRYGSNRRTYGGQLFPSVTQVPLIELRSSDLVTGSFTCWVISPARTLINIFVKENGKSLLDRPLLLGSKQCQ